MLCKCLLLVAITVASATENYSDCPTSLSTLERALYDTGDNLVQLNRIFFPRNTRTSRFVKVVYTFQDDPDLLYDYSNCRNVTFFWAIGSFLFFQPPSIFSFTSLFFNYPNNNINDLKLTLPNECKPLIYSEETQECTCRVNSDTPFHHSSELLHILTQQVFPSVKNPNILRLDSYAHCISFLHIMISRAYILLRRRGHATPIDCM